MKEKFKKHLNDSLKLLEEIGNFCLERKEKDAHKALFYISSNFDSTITLFILLLRIIDNLECNVQDKSTIVDPYKQVGNLITDQSRFAFIATISSLEFTAKKIIFEKDIAIKKLLREEFLKKNKKKKYRERFYLKNIMNASEKLGLITVDEKKEWCFFIEIRNALVHNNAIIDEDLSLTIYGKPYSFKKDRMISGNIQSLFIFSKRIVELFYNWSQSHNKSLTSC